MKAFNITAAQGEVNIKRLLPNGKDTAFFVDEMGVDLNTKIQRIDTLPDGLTELAPDKGVYIVGHSESGNTHVLDAPGVRIMERTKDVPAGMRILYAIVENPTVLRQNAASPHEGIVVEPGLYSFKISREFDPFSEQTRQVQD